MLDSVRSAAEIVVSCRILHPHLWLFGCFLILALLKVLLAKDDLGMMAIDIELNVGVWPNIYMTICHIYMTIYVIYMSYIYIYMSYIDYLHTCTQAHLCVSNFRGAQEGTMMLYWDGSPSPGSCVAAQGSDDEIAKTCLMNGDPPGVKQNRCGTWPIYR